MESRPYDIRERAFLFACQVVSFCEAVARRGYIMRRLAGQLVDAAGSVGANLEEADAGQSKADFISKNSIALKECREAQLNLPPEQVTCGASFCPFPFCLLPSAFSLVTGAARR
jgi:hypothetical protein